MFEVLLNDQEKDLVKRARKFVKEKVPAQLIRDMDADRIQYPHEYIQAVAKEGLYGIRFDKKYGGHGLGWVAEAAVIEEIGVLGNSLGCLYSLPSIIGEAIHLFGTDQQKEKYLAPTIAGKLTCAEGLTEPRGGSDFFGATTRAVRNGDHYILSGQKRFVVGAEGADYFLIYAKTDPDAKPHKSLSVFLVDRTPEVEIAYLYGLLGSRGGGAGRVIFHDVRVPVENLVGPVNSGGMIFNHMMVPERMTSAAGAVGSARAALEIAAKYSTKRKAFGRKIKDFQAVSFKVAESATKIDAARGLIYAAARTVDAGLDGRRLVSEAKKFTTEAAWEVVNDAMQIMGGIGYTNVFPIERMLRDIRLAMIWTGTSEIMSLLIQHEYYSELAAEEGDKRDLEKDVEHPENSMEKIYE